MAVHLVLAVFVLWQWGKHRLSLLSSGLENILPGDEVRYKESNQNEAEGEKCCMNNVARGDIFRNGGAKKSSYTPVMGENCFRDLQIEQMNINI